MLQFATLRVEFAQFCWIPKKDRVITIAGDCDFRHIDPLLPRLTDPPPTPFQAPIPIVVPIGSGHY
jgi:hypothetical protein